MIKSLSLLLALACALSSCSFSKNARQQRAYERYIRKSSVARERQRSHYFKSKQPAMPTSPMPSEPIESTEASPQAYPTES